MKKIILFFILFSSFLLTGCLNNNKENEKLTVISTIPPFNNIVETIWWDKVKYYSLVKYGYSPANYNPTPNDIKNIKNSELFFINWYLPIEKKSINSFKNMNKDIKIINFSEKINLRYFSENSIDPHFWLDPINIEKIAKTIKDNLQKQDPSNKSYYQENYDDFKEKVLSLHNKIKNWLSWKDNKYFLTYHPSFWYFCDRYWMKQISIEKKWKQPSSKYVENLIEKIRQDNIKTIFIQKWYPKSTVNSIQDRVDINIQELDPLYPNIIENLENIYNSVK